MDISRLATKANFHARRGTHYLGRFVGQAPDQRAARRLAATADLARNNGKHILFLTPRDWSSHLHWEAMIAQALRVRGATVDFVTCGGGLSRCDRTTTWEAPPMPCASCNRYATDTIEAHGFPVAHLSDHFGPEEEWPELDLLALDELRRVEIDGLPLGKLVEIPVKWFLLNTQLAEDPLGVLTYREFLRSARRIARAVRSTLLEERPDVLIVLNGLFLFEAIAWQVAKDLEVDVVNYERGYISNTLLFARERPACFGYIDDVWPLWAEQPLLDEERTRLTDYLTARELGLHAIEQYWDDVQFVEQPRSRRRPLTTLFTNLTWDSAVIDKEIAFVSIHEWVFATIDYHIERSDRDLVIRLHPAETKLSGKPTREPIGAVIENRYPTLPTNIRIIGPDDPTSSYPLMKSSDLVTVLTSTTGLEAALRGVPVVVAGDTAYRGKGFTLDASDPEEYIEIMDRVLADPHAHKPDVDLAQRYAYLFFFRLPVEAPGVDEHIRGIIRLTVKDLSDLAPGVSADLDRVCDGILHGRAFTPVP